jgi:hypothetical protein
VFGDFLNGIPAATPAMSIETAQITIAKLERELARKGKRYDDGEITARSTTANVTSCAQRSRTSKRRQPNQ